MSVELPAAAVHRALVAYAQVLGRTSGQTAPSLRSSSGLLPDRYVLPLAAKHGLIWPRPGSSEPDKD
ncbi:DUF2274 domain-containing protein [Nitrospirillum bahiense]|uniref:DUF2274 domain-containing protein n=1 Tax=Nitrospirillum amazonense TaxID=28077 RepID=UPI001FE43525|nr:DUF2274 domain-containing protein [Nitrospirillum amazonense]